MEKTDAVREKALKILIKVFEDKSYSNILIKNLGSNFSQLDRAFITEIVYGTIKWKLRIDNAIGQLSSIKFVKISPSVLNILRMGIYQIEFMDKVPDSAVVNECVKLAKKYGNPGAARYVNAILRNYTRKRHAISYPDKDKEIVQYISRYYSYPEWMVEKIIDDFGTDFAEDFLRVSNSIPSLTIRLNKLKTDKKRLTDMLKEKGIEVHDAVYMPDALILRGVPGINNLDEYRNGLFTVQDESSMLAAQILSPMPGELVVDVCSAPGTKSTYIGELMGNKGRIIAGDIHKGKLKLVEDNAKRLGISIIHTVLHDASKINDAYTQKADRVLVDAPCSGLGIMRKKPEIRWNRDVKDMSQLQRLQRSILDASSHYVKPGGVLVYSTCTVLKGENRELVCDFIRRNDDFFFEDITDFIPDKLRKESCIQGYLELYPNIDGIDGFFIARVRRKG